MKVVFLFACIFFYSSAYAEEAQLSLALGVFDIDSNDEAYFQMQYHFDKNWHGIKPLVGFFITSEDSNYVYVGAGYPITINSSWFLTPSLSVGAYHEGRGKDLGHDLEFYSRITLDYKLKENTFVGLGVGHISNSSIGDRNPGANMVYIDYKIRLQ